MEEFTCMLYSSTFPGLPKIMQEDEINERDFIIRMIPGLSVEGSERRVFEKVSDFRIVRSGEDELNEGKKKLIVSFSLNKGCYATSFLDQLIGDS